MTTFPSALTPGSSTSDAAAYMLGFTFTISDPVTVTGIRFSSPATQTGTGVGLYSITTNTGVTGSATPLASKMQDMASGWNEIAFDDPVTLTSETAVFYAGVLLPSTARWNPLTSQTSPYTEEGSVITATNLGGYCEGPTTLTPGTALTLGLGAAPTRINDNPTTWYGVELVLGDPESDPISLTVERTTGTTATLTWGALSDAPDGVSVLRAPGLLTEDGNGNAFGDPGYDPTTIDGAEVIATGEESPYVDTVPDAEADYTYAVIRTGPA